MSNKNNDRVYILGGEMERDMQDYISLSKRIMNECPKHSKVVDEGYYIMRIMSVYFFSKDSVTGNNCMVELEIPSNLKSSLYKKPYSEWEPSKCESSCVSPNLNQFTGNLQSLLHVIPVTLKTFLVKLMNLKKIVKYSEIMEIPLVV